MLLEEFDANKTAIINPDMCVEKIENFPEVTISCFSEELFNEVLEFFRAKEIASVHSASGLNPIYEVTYKGKRFAMFKSMVGEPLCVGQYEEIIAMGSKRLILLGNCGVLDKRIEDCGIIIPIKAVRDEGTSYHYAKPCDTIDVNHNYRDEGTSYHYAKPCDTIDVNHNYRDEFKKVLKEFGYPYVEGITWTTDACYRETRDKVNKRKEMGAVCVEMECAGMQALCDFRGTEFFQFFYAGDNLDHSSWEPRSLSGSARLDDKSKIMLLAFELGLKILEKL